MVRGETGGSWHSGCEIASIVDLLPQRDIESEVYLIPQVRSRKAAWRIVQAALFFDPAILVS